MNPHTITPARPSSLQWKVGKPAPLWPTSTGARSLTLIIVLVAALMFGTIAIQRVATHRAIHACNIGHTACRLSMGYSRTLIDSEDRAEDQTVCGDGWRACVDASSEGNIQ